MALKAQQVEFLLSENPALAGGTATFYTAGSSHADADKKMIWQDRNKTTPAANPVTLDAVKGTATVFGDGVYDVVLKNAAGVTASTLTNLEIASKTLTTFYDVTLDFGGDLAAAFSSPLTAGKTIVISTPISCSDLTCPADRHIKIEYGGSINPSSGKTFNWNGRSPIAEDYAIHGGSGSVTGLKNSRPQWFGAAGDGVTNDSGAMAKAMAALVNNGTLDLPYTANGYIFNLAITKPCTIQCNGNLLKASGANGSILSAGGTLSSTGYILNGTYSEGSLVLNTTVPVTDFTAGDLVQITDDTARPSDAAKINFEVHKIKSVSSTTVTLEDPLRHPKSVSASWNLKKITPVKGIHIKQPLFQDTSAANTNYGVFMQYCQEVTIVGVRSVNMVAPVVELQGCYDWTVDDMECSSPLAVGSGQGYGLSMAYGSRRGRVQKLYGDGMRHLFDAGSAWDITADGIISHNGVAGDFVVAHNSVGGYIKLRAESYNASGSGRRALSAMNQGVYTTTGTQYNSFVSDLDIDIYISSGDRSANQVGAYFEIPVRNSQIHIRGVCSDGAGNAVSNNTQLIRMQPVKNRNVELWVDSIGYDIPINLQSYDAATTAPDDYFDAVKVRKLYAKNAHFPFSESESNAIHIDELEVDTLMASTGRGIYSSINSAIKLRSIHIGKIRWRSATGQITDLINGDIHADGALGYIGNVEREVATEVPYTLGASFSLYPYDVIESSKDGSTLTVDSGANVTSAFNAFQAGLVEGQRVRLINIGAYTVTVQHSGTLVYNNGAISVVLGAAKHAAEWVWSNNAWWQTQ